MPTYSLEIQIDNTGLDLLGRTNHCVTLTKGFRPTSDNLLVVWAVFPPVENNIVTWTENYSVYASSTQVQAGATVHTIATQAASAGQTYTFNQGHFDNGQPGPPANQYGVMNNDPDVKLLASGLAQVPNLNGNPQGLNPLNAMSILFNESGSFTPDKNVDVFLSENINPREIFLPWSWSISNISVNKPLEVDVSIGKPLEIDFVNHTLQTIHYDDATDTFVMGALPPP